MEHDPKLTDFYAKFVDRATSGDLLGHLHKLAQERRAGAGGTRSGSALARGRAA